MQDDENAHFVNDEGRYFVNWPIAVEEYYKLNANQNSKHGTKAFNKGQASNKLRSALLNHYRKDGACEYVEAQKKNSEGEVIKREFQMPQKIFKKFVGKSAQKKKEDTSREDSIFQVKFIT